MDGYEFVCAWVQTLGGSGDLIAPDGRRLHPGEAYRLEGPEGSWVELRTKLRLGEHQQFVEVYARAMVP